MRISTIIKYITLFLTYNGLLFFVMAFAPFSQWIEFDTGHYGIWRICDGEEGCKLEGFSPEQDVFNALVIPRILMTVSFGLLLISAFFAFRGFRSENAALSFFISGIFQFFSSLFIVAAFLVTYFARTENSSGKETFAFQSMIAVVSGALFALSGIISLGFFCYRKLTQANSVIMLDQKGRAEYVHGNDVAYYED